MSAFFDLASLAKPLVTAPLAHAFLDLDADRRYALGFHERAAPLTVRQLLCHGSGLPPWRPFTREDLAAQLRRPVTGHPLLGEAKPGEATYSDLGYRLLAQLLEQETRIPFPLLGSALSGLQPAPWSQHPQPLPEGPDAEAWHLASPELPLPAARPDLPHDLNARVGMQGHAGFGASEGRFRAWLEIWSRQWALRLCGETSREADGSLWGLGLRAAHRGQGRFGDLLQQVPLGTGLQVQSDVSTILPGSVPPLEGGPGEPSGWWCHFGFTGPAIFFRPKDGACIGLLLHRAGPEGELLDSERLRARRWEHLAAITATLKG